MASKDQMPPKLGHGIGEFDINPTGEKTDIRMGIPISDPGPKVTPMVEGVGEIPIGHSNADVAGVQIDGMHNVGSIDGKEGGGKPESLGDPMTYRNSGTGVDFKYPGL